jgi:hypothetical protein
MDEISKYRPIHQVIKGPYKNFFVIIHRASSLEVVTNEMSHSLHKAIIVNPWKTFNMDISITEKNDENKDYTRVRGLHALHMWEPGSDKSDKQSSILLALHHPQNHVRITDASYHLIISNYETI